MVTREAMTSEPDFNDLPIEPGDPRFTAALELVPQPMLVISTSPEREPRVAAANSAFRALVSGEPVGLVPALALAVTAPDELALIEQVLDTGVSASLVIERSARRFEFTAEWRGSLVVLAGSDVSERDALAAQVAHDARHDPITGLPNAVAFIERLDATLRRPELIGTGAAVVICDLDQYRTISDALGPLSAAEVLRAIGERLERRLRFGDCVARLAGDEFAVLCCDTGDDDDLEALAERLVDALTEPVELDTGEIYLSASAGVARLVSGDDSPERVLRDAHAALSKARRQGQGSVAVFDRSVRDDVVRRVETEKALHRALRRGEFRVYYQPLVRFSGAAVVGFEALVRWQHPERGIVAPIEFIPVAEETGLIVPIGAWVIDEVCRQAAEWQRDATTDPLVVSVNLSARQLAHPGLVGTIAESVGRFGLDPTRLLVEVTESTLMSDPQLATTILHAIRALGVRIAVDDFGTGHSSLGYLKQLPVDCLKIDRSFVSGLGDDDDDRAIVGAVVSMAHALGLSVTAEGVETIEQLDALEALGCDVGQGFYFAKPQPGEIVTALVHHRFRWRRAA